MMARHRRAMRTVSTNFSRSFPINDDVCAFASDIRARAHGYTYCCLAECRGVIDPDAHHGHRSPTLGMYFDFDHFLPRKKV